MSIEEVEKQIRESAPLPDRLTDCKDRIGKMCAEGRPPKMSIPSQWNDDDLFICTTLSDAEAVERELAMKQDDWLKECQENDRLRAALAAAQGEVERCRQAIPLIKELNGMLDIEKGGHIAENLRALYNHILILLEAQEAFGGKP